MPAAKWTWPIRGVSAVELEHPTQQIPKASTDEDPAEEGKEFELRVVGPGGKSIPDAEVELRISPQPTADQILKGKFVRPGPYGAIVATDGDGRLVVKLPPAPKSFDVFITIPGYGPYWAGWTSESHAQPIPPLLTAELEAAWSVGGIIVDRDGKPVEGVQIRPSIEFKKRPGLTRQLAIGTRLKTDAAGKWHFDSVPVSMAEVYVEHRSPELQAGPPQIVAQGLWHRPRSGTDQPGCPGSRPDSDGQSHRRVRENRSPGHSVRTKFVNDIREARTGPDGVYRLAGCEPRAARIVVSAKGRATDMKELNIEPGMGPVDFPMKPGGTVRIRVVDEQGKPVPKARIFFQRWRGMFSYFEFDHVSQYADQNGVWVWNEAPLDEFKADICPTDGMELAEQPLIARAEEYVFRTAGSHSSFRAKSSTRKQESRSRSFESSLAFGPAQTQMNWVPGRELFPPPTANTKFADSHGYFAHLIRIEADGYRAAVSRDIKSTEGAISIDFALQSGQERRRESRDSPEPDRGGGQGRPGCRRVTDQHQERRHR